MARCRLNILISGDTGSGKTTMMNTLSRMIDHGGRIITIEDAAELQLHPARNATVQRRRRVQVTQRDFVRNALRMRPDRIIVGEVRRSSLAAKYRSRRCSLPQGRCNPTVINNIRILDATTRGCGGAVISLRRN